VPEEPAELTVIPVVADEVSRPDGAVDVPVDTNTLSVKAADNVRP